MSSAVLSNSQALDHNNSIVLEKTLTSKMCKPLSRKTSFNKFFNKKKPKKISTLASGSEDAFKENNQEDQSEINTTTSTMRTITTTTSTDSLFSDASNSDFKTTRTLPFPSRRASVYSNSAMDSINESKVQHTYYTPPPQRRASTVLPRRNSRKNNLPRSISLTLTNLPTDILKKDPTKEAMEQFDLLHYKNSHTVERVDEPTSLILRTSRSNTSLTLTRSFSSTSTSSAKIESMEDLLDIPLPQYEFSTYGSASKPFQDIVDKLDPTALSRLNKDFDLLERRSRRMSIDYSLPENERLIQNSSPIITGHTNYAPSNNFQLSESVILDLLLTGTGWNFPERVVLGDFKNITSLVRKYNELFFHVAGIDLRLLNSRLYFSIII